MTEYYCPDDCELQKECSLKHPLPGERFTNNPSNKCCWCYLKPLPPLVESRKTREATFPNHPIIPKKDAEFD